MSMHLADAVTTVYLRPRTARAVEVWRVCELSGMLKPLWEGYETELSSDVSTAHWQGGGGR